jgi:hypothetical protein
MTETAILAASGLLLLAYLLDIAGRRYRFGVVYVSRLAILQLLRQPDARILTWIAPRGLITVLLFIAAADAGKLHGFPFGAVMLVVLATSAATALSQRAAKASALPAAAPALSDKTD